MKKSIAASFSLFFALVCGCEASQKNLANNESVEIIENFDDVSMDGLKDRIAIKSPSFRDVAGAGVKCRKPELLIDLKRADGSYKNVITTSNVFIDDCLSAPGSYELKVKKSVITVMMFYETAGLRIDAKIRINKDRTSFLLIGFDKYSIIPTSTQVTSVNLITRKMSNYGDIKKKANQINKSIELSAVDIQTMDSSRIYYSNEMLK